MIKYKLPNGLVVILHPVENVVSVSTGLWVKTGSRHENTNQYGYAHFTEHMLFKGTSNYSAKDIAQMVDRVGGQHNAATNREHTCYYINVIAEYLDLSLNLLADMFYDSVFDENEISKEKDVIIEEMGMYEDTPDEHIHDIFMETMLNNHSLGHQILGTEKIINGVNRDKIIEFYNQHYSNENALLVVVGKFNIDETKQQIEKYYSKERKSIIKNK
jgi:predicted Zn-dependent peptidase